MAKKKKPKPESPAGTIEWETAEVSAGALTVAISGDVSKAWCQRVTAVVDRLAPPGVWEAVKIGREELRVSGVAQGHEADIRHVLEGAVLQANADLAPPEEGDTGDDDRSAADAEMTAAFRAADGPSV